MPKILITGGVKSGKSSFALKLCRNYDKKLFVATAEAFDSGMKERIKRHQQERKDLGFSLIEESTDLHKIVTEKSHEFDYILIDCITLWVNNLIYYSKDIEEYSQKFTQAIETAQNVIIVTNETGLGIMPENTLAAKYIDNLGIINQKIARVCDEVYLMISGQKLKIK
jgi:adenosylcobinamide kinase/adenosylcobinamide-phosphate guanylyltransferase